MGRFAAYDTVRQNMGKGGKPRTKAIVAKKKNKDSFSTNNLSLKERTDNGIWALNNSDKLNNKDFKSWVSVYKDNLGQANLKLYYDKWISEGKPSSNKEPIVLDSYLKRGGKFKKYPGSGTKDSCYHQAKAKYSVFPSAYASGFISKCRKKKAGKKEQGGVLANTFKKGGSIFKKEQEEGLRGWFSRNKGKGWVNCKTGGTCGRKDSSKGSYPACRPTMSACKKFKKPKGKTSSQTYNWKRK